ncbi:MAG: GldG family protein [Gammaproteobacteria bacterium]|nr:GldG family protein [Gammaproteobacteria bacterium]
MKVSRNSSKLFRLQTVAFTVLYAGIIGMLAWLSTQYVYQADWTFGARNSISPETRELLDTMPGPVTITAFMRDDPLLSDQLKDLVASYQRYKHDITLEIINPDTVPERARELGIASGGEIVISYGDSHEKVQTLAELQFTNALLRLSRRDERWIVFITGHSERKPHGDTNHGLGIFGRELENKGLRVQTHNLSEAAIPENTHLLVLASPQVELLPGEVIALQDYVSAGGNLLWLSEPKRPETLQPLADQLGISFLPGTVVDATGQMFGVEEPTFAIVTGYPRHEITREMSTVSVFPEAAAMDINEDSGWESLPLLTTLARSWTEIGELQGEIRFDPETDERSGPLDIGVVMTRTPETGEDEKEQRVMVIGDGDFLSNTYLGNAGNMALGLQIVHWLSHDDAFISIRVRTAPDASLVLTNTARTVIGFGFLFGLPLLLLLAGLVIWMRRRRR